MTNRPKERNLTMFLPFSIARLILTLRTFVFSCAQTHTENYTDLPVAHFLWPLQQTAGPRVSQTLSFFCLFVSLLIVLLPFLRRRRLGGHRDLWSRRYWLLECHVVVVTSHHHSAKIQNRSRVDQSSCKLRKENPKRNIVVCAAVRSFPTPRYETFVSKGRNLTTRNCLRFI